MAEGLARARWGDSVRVESAGSRPSTVNPWAIEVMRERGVDLAEHRSKSVETIDASSVDVVITLCAEEVCPVFLGRARKLHWPTPDPASDVPLDDAVMLARFRAARDAIDARIAEFSREEAISSPSA